MIGEQLVIPDEVSHSSINAIYSVTGYERVRSNTLSENDT